MRIVKSNKTAKSSRQSSIKCYSDCYIDTQLGDKLSYDELRDYWNKNKLDDPCLTEFNNFKDWLDTSIDNGLFKPCDDVEACGAVKASKKLSANEQALTHIKAAIDILGTSGKKDAVTKDSIANLATVMFDIKASTDTCKYSKSECINAIQAEYGYNKKEAENYYKKTDCKTLEALVEGFKANAKKSFYED